MSNQAFEKSCLARTGSYQSFEKLLQSLSKHDSTRKNHDHEFQISYDVPKVSNQELLKFDQKTQMHDKDKKRTDKGHERHD